MRHVRRVTPLVTPPPVPLAAHTPARTAELMAALLPMPLAALLASLLLTACQAQPRASALGAADEAALQARLRSAIGDAVCSSDAQCRTLAVGEKACGGPEAWWAFSVASAQADQLPGWAAELSALSRQRNLRSGSVSNCQYQPDPGAVCQAQRCLLATPKSAR